MDRNLFIKSCTFKRGAWNCGSYQFNLQKNHIDQGDLCDVHYWQTQAQRPWVGLTAEDINQFETWFDDEEERKGWVDPALIAKYFEAKIKDKNT